MIVTGKLKMDDLKWHVLHKFIHLLYTLHINEFWEIFDLALNGAEGECGDDYVKLTFSYKGEVIESVTFNKDRTFCIEKPDRFVYVVPKVGEIVSWSYVIPASLEYQLFKRDRVDLTGIILKIEEIEK